MLAGCAASAKTKPLWDVWAVDGEGSESPEHTQQGEGWVFPSAQPHISAVSTGNSEMSWINPQLQRLKALIHSSFSLLATSLHF